MDHKIKAAELFLDGYNCAQAVAVAFCDVTGLSESQAAKMASSFGGGIGGLREVCGAVSGMMMVLGSLYGYDQPDNEQKKALYARAQALAESFRAQAGSLICRDLLAHMPVFSNPTPETAALYAKRPCVFMVMTAAELLDGFIAENPLEK